MSLNFDLKLNQIEFCLGTLDRTGPRIANVMLATSVQTAREMQIPTKLTEFFTRLSNNYTFQQWKSYGQNRKWLSKKSSQT